MATPLNNLKVGSLLLTVAMVVGLLLSCTGEAQMSDLTSPAPESIPAAKAHYCGIPDVVACDMMQEVIDYLGTGSCGHLSDVLASFYDSGSFRITDFESPTQSGGADHTNSLIYVDIDYFMAELPQILAHEAHHFFAPFDGENEAYAAENCVSGIPGWQ
jgi:hypothetical protein